MTEHEELLMLRALAAKQAQELEASRKIIKERDEKIRKQNIQIDNMIQALLHARKKIFGPSTEVSRQVDGQLSLFESVQELAEQLNLSKSKITVKPYKRTARQPGIRAEMLAGLPEEIEESLVPRVPKEENTLIFFLKLKTRLKISHMKRKNRSVRKRQGRSLMPFGRGQKKPPQCIP